MNYRGISERFTGDDNNLNDNGIGDDTVSSISVDPGCIATLYNQVNYNRSGHGVVLYGYDRNRRYFIAKNSWGAKNCNPPGDNLIELYALSYDYLDYIYEYAYINSIEPPEKRLPEDWAMRYIGWWKLSLNGAKGHLAISRLPDDKGKRVGNLYIDGKTYRVNGKMNPDGIMILCMDFSKPDIGINNDVCGRYRIDMRIAGADAKYMMGTYYSYRRGYDQGAYAVRTSVNQPGQYLRGIDASPEAKGMIGKWEMNHDGWEGVLTVENASPEGNFQGYYIGQDGKRSRVHGRYGWGWFGKKIPNTVLFTVEFEGGPQRFLGHHHSRERNVIAGQTTWKDRQFGFFLNKVK